MREIDEIDDIFKLMDRLIKNSFSGGYASRYRPNYNEDNYISDTTCIFNYEDTISLSIELKNLNNEDLKVTPNENGLIIEAFLDGEWIRKSIKFPEKVDPKSAKISFNNFILDVELNKVKENDNERIQKNNKTSKK